MSRQKSAQSPSTTGSGDGEQPNDTVTGPVTVSYEIRLTETSRATRSGDYGEIRFHDHCIVLVAKDGKGGVVVPLEKITSPTWRMRD